MHSPCAAPPTASSTLAARPVQAVLFHILQAAGGSTQEWDPCPPRRAQPRGRLLCTPRAPLCLRRAELLQPALVTHIRQAAGGSTQEWDPSPADRGTAQREAASQCSHFRSPAPPRASGALAAGCLKPHLAGRGRVHTRVEPLPAATGTAPREAAPRASGTLAAGCLDPRPASNWRVRTSVGPLPAAPGTAWIGQESATAVQLRVYTARPTSVFGTLSRAGRCPAGSGSAPSPRLLGICWSSVIRPDHPHVGSPGPSWVWPGREPERLAPSPPPFGLC